MEGLTTSVEKEWRDEACRYVTVDVPGILRTRTHVAEAASRFGSIGVGGCASSGLLPSQGSTLEKCEPRLMYVLFAAQKGLATAQVASLWRVAGCYSAEGEGWARKITKMTDVRTGREGLTTLVEHLRGMVPVVPLSVMGVDFLPVWPDERLLPQDPTVSVAGLDVHGW